MVSFGEGLLSRMPIVRPIYRTTKQIFQTLFSGRRVRAFAGSGWWSFRRPACGRSSSSPSRRARRSRRICRRPEHISAFLPCTPNPTTGFFFYVPRADVIDLDISVEQAMSLLISAGIIQPGVEDPQHRLAALAETARIAQAARKETSPAE